MEHRKVLHNYGHNNRKYDPNYNDFLKKQKKLINYFGLGID